MKQTLSNLYKKDGTKSVLASLISIVIGLLVGSVLIVVMAFFSNELTMTSASEGVRLVLAGLFSTGRNAAGQLTWGFNPQSMGNMLFRAMPLVLTGLSVAVAFKTGLFNIGAPGQYLMSTAVTLILALSIPSTAVPAWLIWIIAFLGGILAGAIWGAIPGLVKAYLNINEVLACIMTNWIAANLVTWIFDGSNFRNLTENTKSGYIYKTSFNGVQTAKMGLDKLFPGSQVNGGILIAILIGQVMMTSCNNPTEEAKAKYIFLFIGDGMGHTNVFITESYLSYKAGKFGGEQLTFTTFPYQGDVTNYTAESNITCSAAAGTAIATGYKTRSGFIGVDADTVAHPSIAEILKAEGYRIGIMTSVPMNDATPAVFYAHNSSRGNGYEIAQSIANSGFDFVAGNGFKKHKNKAG